MNISVGDKVKTLDEEDRSVWGVVREVKPNGKLTVRVRGLDETWDANVVVRVVR